ncbi:MAG: hypothetical protein ABA06_00395 [Parcubacteria bacterium C7867-001]|nr:MAG: hypothetical protein ABA06_00395 [Parcubacteria bacterium C7867-001]
MKEFDVPEGMTSELVACTFAAYLLGSLFNSNWQRSVYGPFRKDYREGTDYERWQLDNTNDYWLHIEGNKAKLVSRYDRQDVLEAMLTLFKLRFPQRAHA